MYFFFLTKFNGKLWRHDVVCRDRPNSANCEGRLGLTGFYIFRTWVVVEGNYASAPVITLPENISTEPTPSKKGGLCRKTCVAKIFARKIRAFTKSYLDEPIYIIDM